MRVGSIGELKEDTVSESRNSTVPRVHGTLDKYVLGSPLLM